MARKLNAHTDTVRAILTEDLGMRNFSGKMSKKMNSKNQGSTSTTKTNKSTK
ncbi:hypothetical protein Cfor_02184 [Coptotermes formosanus]|uniref:Uncharacterized protein n=1 Tax=Coptotermes formosanus TaxID=36987 RepID=A0A6L2QAM8_COPFO|nr:hypothetical protein Cfor_02184 [Coptotermes formosanus]